MVMVAGVYKSPIGSIVVTASESGVTELNFSDEPVNPESKNNLILEKCLKQLDEYFSGLRTTFDVELDLRGTEFRMAVWRALLLLPYGKTSSYGRLAASIGRPKAGRAVGGANHNNPVSIIVPCHRVIGGDGSLVGYGGGLDRKKWLLAHEAAHAGKI
jgi:methylated-DNA-[protein]-cysteine S-methyltransferase